MSRVDELLRVAKISIPYREKRIGPLPRNPFYQKGFLCQKAGRNFAAKTISQRTLVKATPEPHRIVAFSPPNPPMARLACVGAKMPPAAAKELPVGRS